MNRVVEFDGQEFQWSWWNGEVLSGTVDCPLAYDSETVAMAPGRPLREGETVADVPPSPLSVPEPVLGIAYDGKALVVIHRDRLTAFVRAHRSRHAVLHNAAFDFHSLHRHSDKVTQEFLWQWVEGGRWHDSMLLDMLLQLASGVYRSDKGGGAEADEKKIWPTSLGVLAAEWGCGELDKTDPYRLRFGELKGLTAEQIEGHPEGEGFLSYALRDVLATWRVYPKQRARAVEWMRKAGWSPDPRQQRYEIRPDALERWGPLGELIQVRGSIALSELSRTPLRIDEGQRAQLERATRERYQRCLETLMREEPHLFWRFKPKKYVVVDGQRAINLETEGPIKFNKKTNLPLMNDTVLKERLQKEADRLGFPVPISKGKTKAVSRAVKDWDGHAGESEFLRAYCGLASEIKLLSFFLSLQSENGVVYTNYDLLKRSGRTSATAHRDRKKTLLLPSVNIQQIPRENEDEPERDVRRLFLPEPGQKWLTVDYKAIELVTLAASCVARFGYSKMRDGIVQNVKHGGPDLHQITGAALGGVTIEEFFRLPEKEQAKLRKDAKFSNFGLGGGMGPEKLSMTARRAGLDFTRKKAAELKKVWLATYPEMQEHLADHTVEALAWNSGLPAKRFEHLSWLQRKRYSDFLRGTAQLTPNEREMFFELVDTVGFALKDEGLMEAASSQVVTPRVKQIFQYRAATLTGRVRSNCTYSSAANAVFQGLTSDGAKEGLFKLMRMGLKPILFVHDEICWSVDAAKVQTVRKQVERIMVEAMEATVGHGVPVAVESGVGDYWTKG